MGRWVGEGQLLIFRVWAGRKIRGLRRFFGGGGWGEGEENEGLRMSRAHPGAGQRGEAVKGRLLTYLWSWRGLAGVLVTGVELGGRLTVILFEERPAPLGVNKSR